MTTEQWEWWASRDEERYDVGPEASREAVIELATNDFDGERFHIIEATKGTPNLRIFDDADLVIEDIDEQNEQHVDPDGDGSIFFNARHLTNEIKDDLTRRLNDAVEAWVKDHGISIRGYGFDRTRNGEWVEPVKTEAAPKTQESI